MSPKYHQRTSGLHRIHILCGLVCVLLVFGLTSCTPVLPLDASGITQTGSQQVYVLDLSEEERQYIEENPLLHTGLIGGSAPLLYIDTKGEPQGISLKVLDEISRRTGLGFAYTIYPTVAELQAADLKIFPLLAAPYRWDPLVLSDPYLTTETVLYLHRGISADNLADKRFAAVRGGTLPEGIREDQTIYFESRESALDAVEHGKADFGYGNAYSIAYLSLQKGYRNIVTVPQGKEVRQYSIGVKKDNPILLSIVNKALGSITDSQMQSLLLDVAGKVERTITISMIMGQYGGRILLVSFLVILTLIILSLLIVRTTIQLQRQNRRYEALFEISQEYLFEYEDSTSTLTLSSRTITLFGSQFRINRAIERLGSIMRDVGHGPVSEIIRLEIADGNMATFRLTTVRIQDPMGKRDSYIGRLSDISEEEREKAQLRTLVITDGLTGVLNQVAARQRIEGELQDRPTDRTDVLILMDCDKFKHINDTFGHLEGDRYLVNLAESLIALFPSNAIIGRVGGDEFCVYLTGIESIEEVLDISAMINPAFQERVKSPFSISIGITVVQKEDDRYVDLFRRADIALYAAKDQGGGRAQVYTG
jgi:diguanylate cyclase (GGDEF)-like protein